MIENELVVTNQRWEVWDSRTGEFVPDETGVDRGDVRDDFGVYFAGLGIRYRKGNIELTRGPDGEGGGVVIEEVVGLPKGVYGQEPRGRVLVVGKDILQERQDLSEPKYVDEQDEIGFRESFADDPGRPNNFTFYLDQAWTDAPGAQRMLIERLTFYSGELEKAQERFVLEFAPVQIGEGAGSLN